MLKSITLENYKCFKEATEIEIAPLTVLCGVNSSGKSSILKSLLMLKQSYEGESTSHSFLFSGEYVDNGSFDDIVYHTSGKDIPKDACFTISTTYLIKDTSDEDGKNLIKRQDIATFKELKKIFFNTLHGKNLKAFKITTSIEALRPTSSDSTFEFFIESNIIRNYRVDIELLDSSQEVINKTPIYIHVIRSYNPASDDKNEWFMTWEGIPSPTQSTSSASDYRCICYFSGLQIRNIYAANMDMEIRNILPNILSIFKITAFQSDGFSFIAPLRQQPARRYNINGNANSVGLSGEKTPILLAKEYNNKKTDCVPPVARTTSSNVGTRWKTTRTSFKTLTNKWMEYLGLGELSLSGANGLVELNINGHNIVDVGFGVGQALPIIVQGLYMTQDETLLLEQPEIHLHPEMQLRIADFLIALARNEKQVIVETHSDHLVNRIVRRAMEDSDIQKLVRIYFFEKDTTGISHKNNVEIDTIDGALCDNPNFFYQFANETESILNAGYNNLQRKAGGK